MVNPAMVQSKKYDRQPDAVSSTTAYASNSSGSRSNNSWKCCCWYLHRAAILCSPRCACFPIPYTNERTMITPLFELTYQYVQYVACANGVVGPF